jgi:Putative cyclase
VAGGQWRVQFDAEVTFLNGGGLRVWGFRLDVPRREVTGDEIAALLIGELGLLMVDRVQIQAAELIAEPHKGTRRAQPAPPGPRQVVTLSSQLADPAAPGATVCQAAAPGRGGRLTALVDLPGILVRTTGSHAAAVHREALLAAAPAGRAVLLHTGSPAAAAGPALTEEAARWLVGEGVALAGLDCPAGRVLGTPAARVFAAAGVPLLAGLVSLASLPASGFVLHAVPGPGLLTAPLAPVQVYALIPER